MNMELLIFRFGIVNLRSAEISVKYAIFYCGVTSFQLIRISQFQRVCDQMCDCLCECVKVFLLHGTQFSLYDSSNMN